MKKQKGMTLLEVVISIAAYGLIALFATEIMTSMNTLMRATSQMNDRLSYESKYADNFQTQNDRGEAFASKAVSYTVSYDGHIVGGSARTALEYTTAYDINRLSDADRQNYVVGHVDYRFMSFDKVTVEPSEFPGDSFLVYVRFVPYFSDEVPATLSEQKAQIQSANNELAAIGDMTVTMNTGSFLGTSDLVQTNSAPHALGDQWILDIFNTSETVPEGVNNISTQMTFNTTKDAFNDGTQLSWADNDVEIFFYVRVGTSDLNQTFYNRCVVEFNVNTGEMKPYKSLVATEDLPAITDYNAILAS